MEQAQPLYQLARVFDRDETASRPRSWRLSARRHDLLAKLVELIGNVARVERNLRRGPDLGQILALLEEPASLEHEAADRGQRELLCRRTDIGLARVAAGPQLSSARASPNRERPDRPLVRPRRRDPRRTTLPPGMLRSGP